MGHVRPALPQGVNSSGGNLTAGFHWDQSPAETMSSPNSALPCPMSLTALLLRVLPPSASHLTRIPILVLLLGTQIYHRFPMFAPMNKVFQHQGIKRFGFLHHFLFSSTPPTSEAVVLTWEVLYHLSRLPLCAMEAGRPAETWLVLSLMGLSWASRLS